MSLKVSLTKINLNTGQNIFLGNILGIFEQEGKRIFENRGGEGFMRVLAATGVKLDEIKPSLLKGSGICHPKICLLGTRIILS